MKESSIGEHGAVQIEITEPGQAGEVNQPGPTKGRVREVEIAKFLAILKISQAAVGDLCPLQAELTYRHQSTNV